MIKEEKKEKIVLITLYSQSFIYIYKKFRQLYITVAPSLQCYDFYTKITELNGFNLKSPEENEAIYFYWMGMKNVDRNIRIVIWVDKDSSSNVTPDFNSYSNVG